MKRDKSKRHPRLKNIAHAHEFKRDDGTFDIAAMEANLPEVVAAFKSGNPQILDIDQTEPNENGKYYAIWHLQAK